MSEKTTSLKVLLTSGRTIEQGKTLVGTKISTAAKEHTAVCFMDQRDMDKLALVENDSVRIVTSEGEIVVKARLSKDAPHQGIIFMPLGIYANWVTPPGEAGIGVPKYKGIDAVIQPTDAKVPEVEELLQILMKREEREKQLNKD
jgi:formylmethanofuran dehydrogenase subunit D